MTYTLHIYVNFKKQVLGALCDLKECWHYIISAMPLYYLFKKYLFWYKYIYKQICVQQTFLSLQTIIRDRHSTEVIQIFFFYRNIYTFLSI